MPGNLEEALISLWRNDPIDNCFADNLNIEQHAPIAHVIKIVLDTMPDGRIAAAQAIDLSPPRDAALHVVACHVGGDFLTKFLNEKSELRPRPDNAHIAAKNIKELRKLI